MVRIFASLERTLAKRGTSLPWAQTSEMTIKVSAAARTTAISIGNRAKGFICQTFSAARFGTATVSYDFRFTVAGRAGSSRATGPAERVDGHRDFTKT